MPIIIIAFLFNWGKFGLRTQHMFYYDIMPTISMDPSFVSLPHLVITGHLVSMTCTDNISLHDCIITLQLGESLL